MGIIEGGRGATGSDPVERASRPQSILKQPTVGKGKATELLAGQRLCRDLLVTFESLEPIRKAFDAGFDHGRRIVTQDLASLADVSEGYRHVTGLFGMMLDDGFASESLFE